MKSVVMIAYYFPPEGNAGAHRPLRFIRQLPSVGWEPTVVTLETTFHERYDPSLLDKVPRDVKIIRVGNADPWLGLQEWRGKRAQKKNAALPSEKRRKIREAEQSPLRSLVREAIRTAEAWCYHPDTARGWIRPAVKATVRVCANRRPDVVWATAGPVSSLIVAQRVSARTRKPYVLDFRDAWTITYNEFEARRPAWAVRKDRRQMFELLKGAQAVVFRYDSEAECYWRAYPAALQASKIHIIPNGYEGSIDNFVPPQGERCEILYTGTLSDYRYDSLLQALSFLKRSSLEVARRLHLQFIGEGNESLARAAAALDLSDMVTTRGATSQEEISKLARQAHALLILGRSSTMKGYELFAAAKLFGYLKAGRPILGVLPNDETKKILTEVGVGAVADVESVSEITVLLRRLVEAFSQGDFSDFLPKREVCEIYSAERQTTVLVRALEGLPAEQPFVPGSVAIPPSLRAEIDERAAHFQTKPDSIAAREIVTRS